MLVLDFDTGNRMIVTRGEHSGASVPELRTASEKMWQEEGVLCRQLNDQRQEACQLLRREGRKIYSP